MKLMVALTSLVGFAAAVPVPHAQLEGEVDADLQAWYDENCEVDDNLQPANIPDDLKMPIFQDDEELEDDCEEEIDPNDDTPIEDPFNGVHALDTPDQIYTPDEEDDDDYFEIPVEKVINENNNPTEYDEECEDEVPDNEEPVPEPEPQNNEENYDCVGEEYDDNEDVPDAVEPKVDDILGNTAFVDDDIILNDEDLFLDSDAAGVDGEECEEY